MASHSARPNLSTLESTVVTLCATAATGLLAWMLITLISIDRNQTKMTSSMDMIHYRLNLLEKKVE